MPSAHDAGILDCRNRPIPTDGCGEHRTASAQALGAGDDALGAANLRAGVFFACSAIAAPNDIEVNRRKSDFPGPKRPRRFHRFGALNRSPAH